MGICYSTKNSDSHRREENLNGFTERSSGSRYGNKEKNAGTANGFTEGYAENINGIEKSSKSPYRASPFSGASPFRPSPFRGSSPFKSPSPGNGGTPGRSIKRPFPPPSPAKHIQAALLKRHGKAKAKESAPSTPSHTQDSDKSLEKTFGYSKNISVKYELGEEIGRGHFGHTCYAKVKKGELKGQSVAVKVINKAKMTTAIAIEDVRREVKILKALTGHRNLVKFYDVYEDNANVYIVMELCEGGELLDRILSRGGKYPEEDAKVVIAQILNIVAFCHFQGVVHRDLKPENFLFTAKDENAELKAIDFGLSDFVRPDERLNDIVGSAYYVAPEVLHRSYSIEADVWSIGVITYILLCGSRPFWARTESGIFRSVLKSEPSFDEVPWPILSLEAKNFVRRLLNKDRHKRMTAAQALAHPWIRGYQQVPLDILIFRLIKTYLRSSIVRKAALKAFSKTLSEDDLFYLRAQFMLLEPSKNGRISLDNLKAALMRNATDAMKDSRMLEMISSIDAVQFKKMDFQEFCAAAISVPQFEGLERWEQQAHNAYQIFEREGNRVVMIEDLARELGVPPTVPAHVVLRDWVRHSDGKLSFFGFTNLLRGMPPRSKPQ
ncbi:hypothetical protein KP509_14G053400 [Ceratopteris richardii]|uniref:Protein kinase domain-containing protein n=2 Tax=Ceratopteris richardii TaxID=49495 RepID=A0A8T2T9T7_CERRI|nr:hypothetical protein KP509_14G053400 [Ceratopteris richardii]